MGGQAVAPRSARTEQPPEDPWWDYAHATAVAMASGREPPTAAIYGPLLHPGEVGRLHAPAEYSRFQRPDDTPTPGWHLRRSGDVLVTSHRIMASRPQGGWLAFWYQDLAEWHTDLPTRTLTMSFAEDQCAPVRLHGPAVPAIALWSAQAVFGAEWQNDPRLIALATPSPAAQHRREQERAAAAARQAWMKDNAARATARRAPAPAIGIDR